MLNFVRSRAYNARLVNGRRSITWWLMGPGLGLIAVALAIVAWPELLAYLTATVLLALGVTLAVWGWRVR